MLLGSADSGVPGKADQSMMGSVSPHSPLHLGSLCRAGGSARCHVLCDDRGKPPAGHRQTRPKSGCEYAHALCSQGCHSQRNISVHPTVMTSPAVVYLASRGDARVKSWLSGRVYSTWTPKNPRPQHGALVSSRLRSVCGRTPTSPSRLQILLRPPASPSHTAWPPSNPGTPTFLHRLLWLRSDPRLCATASRLSGATPVPREGRAGVCPPGCVVLGPLIMFLQGTTLVQTLWAPKPGQAFLSSDHSSLHCRGAWGPQLRGRGRGRVTQEGATGSLGAPGPDRPECPAATAQHGLRTTGDVGV